MLHSTFILSLLTGAASAALSDSNLEKHVGSLSLSASFNPIKEAYWTGLPHHRRTPFSVSPDGKSAYLAYLDASDTDVHVQQVNPSTFAAVGDAVTVTGGKEAGGLVAHNDGFALLTNEALPSGTQNAPADNTPVPVLYRYTSGKQSWKTFLGGPGVHEADGLSASPDLNGDLAFSEASGVYGAYFVITDYQGNAAGHFGDSIQYVTENGTLETIQGASSSWGCSHNTGIAFEAADSAPFASICAEDQGAIWLNTKTQTMNGVKISNENVTNGASGEPMGGMSGSYSSLARFIDADSYIFTWVSRGAKDLTTNDWLGAPFTHSVNRTANRNVAIAQFSDKNTLVGEQATSELGADGDSQVNWITTGDADHSNAHVAAFDGTNALVTWEEIAEPSCPLVAFGCQGAFTGTYYQLVNGGKKVGEPVKSLDTYVAGDMVTMGDGRICWPYVDMDWKLDGPIQNAASVKEISFACMSLDGSGSSSPSASAPAASSTPAASSAAQSSAQVKPSSVKEVADSTGAPIMQTSAAASQSTPAPQAPTDETALPTFEIVSSGATATPPASSSTPIVDIPLPSIENPLTTIEIPLTTLIPFNPSEAPAFTSSTERPNPTIGPISSSTPCSSSEDSVPTEVPEVPPSAALPTETPEASEAPDSTPCTKGTGATPSEVPEDPLSTALPVETPAPTSEPQPEPEAPLSSKTPCSSGAGGIPTEAAEPPSSAALPTELPPFPTGTGIPPFPFPSGAPFPSGGWGHHHGHHHPSGWSSWPTGFGPRPTGRFPFGGQRPSGFALGSGSGFGASKTPCGFETRVRPTPTAGVQ